LTLAAINSRNYTGAITDGLTRLNNKRYGLIRLDEAIYAAKRYQSPLGLSMCDIDYFKQVNDHHGHPAGDTVLREIGRRISCCVRKSDIAVRYGGEEFMLILPGAGPDSLSAIGEKIRQAVATSPIDLGVGGVSLPLTISVGIAAFHTDRDSGEALIARADAALYRAKETGRNRVVLDL
jgi:diguanylate cyclase (GGDEF)-like protein